MISIVWHNGEVPKHLKTRQVYGVVFTEDGRTLLKVENKKDGRKIYSLAGGTPEDFDADRIATLRREFIEEVNTELGENVFLVGYQTISGDGPDYAQVRMTALIKQIHEKLPDPDNGITFDRLLTSPQRAIELLNWVSGDKLINSACEIAKKEFNLTFENCLPDEYV